ncbi:unnamed protein product [Danaus chrysippus]|uniref:(African queen) hypothetical protein n=1 Tax=Danaus chrysippus TaxID=151541 RepID=A0A8J2QSL6_9NEOP|nr:unnamed protein product [Danaus chrysippus]
MQATLPPMWSEIERFRRRRGRLTLSELTEITARAHQLHLQMFQLSPQELRRLRELHARLDWSRSHRPEIVLYTPAQLRQLISLSRPALDIPRASPPFPRASPPSPAGPWRPGPLGAPWHLPDSNPSSEPRSEWSWRGARGWGAGALLLIAALLLHEEDVQRNGRQQMYSLLVGTYSHLSPPLPPDPPPPYTALQHEEPPPPYCHVAFTNKPQSPTVHIYLTGNEPVAHSSNGFNQNTENNIDDNQKTSQETENEENTQININNDSAIDNETITSERSIDNQNRETQNASRNEETC